MKCKYFLIFIVLISFIQSCIKKGNDDPIISLRTRTARVEGDWTITSNFINSVNQYAIGQGGSYLLNKDGSGKYTFINGSSSTSNDVEWSFLNKNNGYKSNERISIYNKGNSEATIWDIIELRHNKIRLKRNVLNSNDSSVVHSITLEPK